MSSAKEAYEANLRIPSDIQGHLQRLYEAAHGNCLEIGVRGGMSTSALLAGVEDNGGFLFSVDIADCPVFEGHTRWNFTRADSIKEAQRILDKIPNLLDVVFIDGDHSFEGCLSDLQNFASRGQRVFVHDIDCPDTYPGVRKAVEQFIEETGRKVIYHSGSYGMAEIE